MQIEQELAQITLDNDSVITVGVFDGVHKGHRQLLNALTAEAAAKGCVPGVLTFRNHPDSIFRTDFQPQYITSLEKRIRLMKDCGVGFVVPVTFDKEMANIRAEDFARLLQQKLRMKGMIIGPDFAMGHKREGDKKMLSALGSKMGFTVQEVDLMVNGGKAVRSTHIRQAIASGDISTAAEMLGRHFSLTGKVGHGDKRGRELGFPTANLEVSPNMAVPANGIYATFAYVDGQRHMAATSIGTRPTFDGVGRSIEAFLLEFDSDLYNSPIRLEFIQRLRDELKFDDVEGLLEQMNVDVQQTREILQAL
ncbi:MAG: bifunctional riboflavin kinase/FAD synthetase [Chloroflexi bacterium]|nr:bifunctional riboflavin kinase/FAD synthetase [Chloroflexota bacterium]